MAKELIISANVHEKKVAILEDGIVTEFYVERRDENQGVVGNLYKGRVMKVLPGMQSAFVDIGLDRDAFLYVSDFTEFMEEEEEIDFREAGGEQRAQRQDDRSRRERPQPGAAAIQRQPTEPSAEERAESMRFDDAVEHVAEIVVERVIPPPPPDETPIQHELAGEVEAAPVVEFLHPTRREPEALEFDIMGEGFEAVAEEEAQAEAADAAEEVGLRAKRGRAKRPGEIDEDKSQVRKRPSSRRPPRGRRGGRAEPEAAAEPEVIAESATEPDRPQFERITDDESGGDAGDLLKDAILQEKIIDRIHEAEYKTEGPRPEPEPEWRVGSFRSSIESAGFQRVVDESGEEAATPVSSGESQPALEAQDESSGSPFRHVSDVVSAFYNRFRSRPIEGANQASESSSTPTDETQAAAEGRASDAGNEEDRDAAIRDRGPRGEFAVRRGGRGRRGRRRPDGQGGVQAVAKDSETASPSVEGEAPLEPPAAPPIEGEAAPAEAPVSESRTEPRRPPEGRARPDRRPEPQRRPEPSSRRRPDRPAAATISDLLHEGQEILVQIAKEPIAKKGARITSHIALPGRYLVYMPTVNHVGVSRKIPNEVERVRLKRTVGALRDREGASGGFIARTACAGHTEQELHDDMRYLIRTWTDVRKKTERSKSPTLVHRDLDLVQRILRDQLSEEFTAIRIDNEIEYARIVEFVNRVQPKLVKRVKLHVGNQPILEKHGVQSEIDKAVRPRVWLKSGGYIVINQTEALVAIDVNTGKFVGKSDKLEDTITRTNLEAAKEIVRQIRLRDLGGIIVLDLIDMEERKNRQKVMMALQHELSQDRAPSKILSINDFGLVAITRRRVKQSLERTLCTPCPYCQGGGMVKSAQTMCFEILEQAKAISKQSQGNNDVMLRVSPHVAEALRTSEREVMEEVEAHFGTPVTIEPDPNLHQEQFDFAIV